MTAPSEERIILRLSMYALLLRGLRLLRSNPRIFLQRLLMLIRRPMQGSQALMSIARLHKEVDESYAEWMRISRRPIANQCGPPETGPLLSVIMPVHDVDEAFLRAAIESVLGQTYPHWQLCIADDASTRPYIRQTLDWYAAHDLRIRVEYRESAGHISAASNTAVSLASGEFVVLLDHDDVLADCALAEIAAVIVSQPDVDFIYSDEDKISPEGVRSDPFFKPAWSPTLLTSCNYVTHLAAIRRTLVRQLGGFRDETVGSQDHDLFLRVAEVARSVAHIPLVLYSWRTAPGSTAVSTSAKPYAVEAARRAITDAVHRRGLAARVRDTELNGIFAVRYAVESPRVSFIVLGQCTAWEHLLSLSNIEITDVVYVDGEPLDPIRVPGASGIGSLKGEYLVWIDSNSRALHSDSVTALIEQLQVPGTGIASGLTSRRGQVLQAGMWLDRSNQPAYAYAGLSLLPYRNFYANLKNLPHEVAAGWVGCCATTAELWSALSGWNTTLPPSLAMIDFSLRAREAGYSIVYTPWARFERSTPLDPLEHTDSGDWPSHTNPDPFLNSNLNPSRGDGLPFRGAAEGIRVQAVRPVNN